MRRKSPFKHHRFPCEIILCAVRWYLGYSLSYQDVVDLLAERGISVDRSSVYRWVQKFAPEITKRTGKPFAPCQCRLTCPLSADHFVIAYRAMDETYIRVGGKCRYLWRAIDANGLPLGTLLRNALPGSG